MRKLLEDIFGDPKEKQDFIIALVVVMLFGVAILWRTLPDRSNYADELLSPSELAIKSNQLEAQKIPANNTIVSDLNRGYSPYYDHKEKEIIMSRALEKTELEETKLSTDALIAANLAKAKEQKKLNNQAITKEYEDLEEDLNSDIIEKDELIEEEVLSDEEIAEDIENTEILPEEESENLVEEEFVEEESEVMEKEEPEEALTDESTDEAMAAAKLQVEEEEAERLAEEQKAKEEREAVTNKERRESATKNNSGKTLSGCHVIVGVFKNRANARGFRDKVSAADFDAKIGKVKGRTYVAVPVDCSNNWEMKNMQKRVNEAFDLKSWILKN